MHGGINVQQRAAGADELLAGDLAGVVRELSRKEEEQWRIGDPAPLSVRWHSAEQDLFDYWENIQASPPRADLVSLSGQFTTIRDTFQATGSQRLLVLGRAGAGKTVLAHRLILDLLEHRGHREPVPVLFSLNDWNPTTTGLRDWMANRLVRDHPFLEQHNAIGKRSAELLVDRDWILPVLDGFDELPEHHHHAAITEVSRVRWPMMVTSRPIEYARAARTIKAVGRAAAIELEDLTLEQTEQYLRRSTKPSRAAEWEAVFEYLRTAPETAASHNLTPVLATPLMVMLARTTYNDTNEHSPHELLNTTRFPTREELEKKLLGGYIDTVYTPSHTTPSGAAFPAWDPNRARHWLGFLATGLSNRNTHDFTWWQLPSTLHRRTRILTTTATVGFVFGLVAALLGGLIGPPLGRLNWVLSIGLPFGLSIGFGVGLAVGFINEVGLSRRRSGQEPERLRLDLRRRGGAKRSSLTSLKKSASEFTNGLVVGLAGGLAGALANMLVFGRDYGLAEQLAEGLVVGLVFGLVFGIVYGLVNVAVSALGDSHDPHTTNPWTLLTRDRKVTLIRTIASVLTAGLVVVVGSVVLTAWYRPGQEPDLNASLLVEIPVGLMAGMVRLALSAWGNWLLFARLWLPLSGRLPRRPKRFLEDAYDRGVLRQAGAAYQFRHAQLRDHFADQHRKTLKSPLTTGTSTTPE